MAAENDFLLVYAESDNRKRIDIIFEHYDNFLDLADMFEERLFDDIRQEKAFNRREARGDLGIRVQTSGKSDPTCMEATGNLTLIQDIQEGNFDGALKGADEDMKHDIQLQALQDMRTDYKDLNDALIILPAKERKEVRDLLTGERDLQQIADDSKNYYESAKSRVYRNRRKVKKKAIEFIEDTRRKQMRRWEELNNAKDEGTSDGRGIEKSCEERSEKVCRLQRSNETLSHRETYYRRAG